MGTNTPGQAKTTAPRFGNYVSPSVGQEKTTIGQFTNTPRQAKTTIRQVTNTPSQVKTSAPPVIAQVTTTVGQLRTTGSNPWPWQQKTTLGQFKTSAGRLEANQITTRAPYPVKS